MGFLSTENKQNIFIYSEESQIGREALKHIEALQQPLRIINLNKESISHAIWLELAAMLNLPIGNLFNSKHHKLTEKENFEDFFVADWLKLVENYPSLLTQPIAIKANEAKIISEPSQAAQFLSNEVILITKVKNNSSDVSGLGINPYNAAI